MELVALVGVEHARHDLAVARRARSGRARRARPPAPRRCAGSKSLEVREQVADRVADLAVGLGHAADHVVGDPHVLAVVDHDRPQPQDLGAVARDHLVGVDVVAEALRDLAALAVDGEAVGDHLLVGRAPARADADQQRRVEPAAVLVAALEVDVAGPGQVRARAQHHRVRRARVEPDVEDVALLVELGAGAARAGEARGQQLLRLARVPGVGALLLEEVRPRGAAGRAAAGPCRSPCSRRPGSARPTAAGARCTSRGASRSCCGCAPRPRPGSQRVAAIAASACSRSVGLALVEGDEPLLGGAEDDRVLAAPADG